MNQQEGGLFFEKEPKMMAKSIDITPIRQYSYTNLKMWRGAYAGHQGYI